MKVELEFYSDVELCYRTLPVEKVMISHLKPTASAVVKLAGTAVLKKIEDNGLANYRFLDSRFH